jgi:hypothetical protein
MISGFPPGMNNLPPMARKIFLLASTSFEARCQCPMVTPTVLNGAGCAAAMPAVSTEASNKPTNIFVFTDASLLSWISKLFDHALTPSPYSKYHAPCR